MPPDSNCVSVITVIGSEMRKIYHGRIVSVFLPNKFTEWCGIVFSVIAIYSFFVGKYSEAIQLFQCSLLYELLSKENEHE